MEMHQVRYFLAVCRELNFTRAAEKCNVAQPSLTRAIKLLEEELGGPLFHRERANTHLSELGKIVQPYLEQVMAQTDEVKRSAKDFAQLKKTTLKLGVMCTIAPTHLLGLLQAVKSRHPEIELELHDAGAGVLQERLIAGDLEAAIYCLPQQGEDERLHYLPLYREQFFIIVSPEHHLAAKNRVAVSDLNGEAYCNRINCEWQTGDPIFRSRGAIVRPVFRSERDDWVLAMVAAGMGFGFMPEASAAHAGVVVRPLVEPEFWREVSLVTVRGRPHSPAVGALVREAMRAQWIGKPALGMPNAKDTSAAESVA
jgi:LysR family hydrogen peroxide-inducible transcriptional activator